MDHCVFLSTVELDPVSAAIRLRTECSWSHVGFMRLADSWTFSAMEDGHGVAWRAPDVHAKILKLSAPNVDAALAEALSQQGKPYDAVDITGIALGFNWAVANHFICSTLVVWAFQQAGAPLLNPTFIPLDHVTPRDILLSPSVTQLL